MNNLRDGIVWYASEHCKDPERLAKTLAWIPDATLHRALVKIAAERPDLLDRLAAESAEKEEFSCSEQPDPLRMPDPFKYRSAGDSVPRESLWWPCYDVQTVRQGDVDFFQGVGKSYSESNQYLPGSFPSGNQFALYEVELRFKRPINDPKAVFRLHIADKIYMIVPLENMYVKTTAPNTLSIGTVMPFHIQSHTPFRAFVSFGPTDPSEPPNAVRCIFNGYKLRDLM